MTEPIDRATVAQVARLARLHLSEDEAGRMQHDLAEILAFVARLDKLDTERAKTPTGIIDRSAPLADDLEGDALPADALARMSPAKLDRFIAIPSVLEGGPGPG